MKIYTHNEKSKELRNMAQESQIFTPDYNSLNINKICSTWNTFLNLNKLSFNSLNYCQKQIRYNINVEKFKQTQILNPHSVIIINRIMDFKPGYFLANLNYKDCQIISIKNNYIFCQTPENKKFIQFFNNSIFIVYKSII